MATAAAAMVAKAQREVRQFFEEKTAFDTQSAVAYEAPDTFHERQLEVLVHRGIIRDAGGGRYWLDRNAIAVERRFQATVLKAVLALVAIAVIIWVAMALLRSV